LKALKTCLFVIPAKMGIQKVLKGMDSCWSLPLAKAGARMTIYQVSAEIQMSPIAKEHRPPHNPLRRKAAWKGGILLLEVLAENALHPDGAAY
jgi:hypothetical protein